MFLFGEGQCCSPIFSESDRLKYTKFGDDVGTLHALVSGWLRLWPFMEFVLDAAFQNAADQSRVMSKIEAKCASLPPLP